MATAGASGLALVSAESATRYNQLVLRPIPRQNKAARRLQAARDVTAQTRSQVADNERTLTFNVVSEFIAVELAESTLELANQDLKSFQNTLDITEAQRSAGIHRFDSGPRTRSAELVD